MNEYTGRDDDSGAEPVEKVDEDTWRCTRDPRFTIWKNTAKQGVAGCTWIVLFEERFKWQPQGGIAEFSFWHDAVMCAARGIADKRNG